MNLDWPGITVRLIVSKNKAYLYHLFAFFWLFPYQLRLWRCPLVVGSKLDWALLSATLLHNRSKSKTYKNMTRDFGKPGRRLTRGQAQMVLLRQTNARRWYLMMPLTCAGGS
jgi:hypothetical protein